MNWATLGAIAELVGALAVLVTLVYLTMQIRQNNVQLRLAAREAISRETSTFRLAALQDGEVAEIFVRGSENLANLNETEVMRFRMAFGLLMQPMVGVFTRLQEDPGAYDEGFIDRLLMPMFERSGNLEMWAMTRHHFPSDFVAYVDSKIRSVGT